MGAVTCYLLARIFTGEAAAIEIAVYGVTAAFGLDFLVSSWRDQFYRHYHSAPRQRDDLDAAAVFCLGTICHSVPTFVSLPTIGISGCHAADGSSGWDDLLPAFGHGSKRRTNA